MGKIVNLDMMGGGQLQHAIQRQRRSHCGGGRESLVPNRYSESVAVGDSEMKGCCQASCRRLAICGHRLPRILPQMMDLTDVVEEVVCLLDQWFAWVAGEACRNQVVFGHFQSSRSHLG
jgi:hypothetical protein